VNLQLRNILILFMKRQRVCAALKYKLLSPARVLVDRTINVPQKKFNCADTISAKYRLGIPVRLALLELLKLQQSTVTKYMVFKKEVGSVSPTERLIIPGHVLTQVILHLKYSVYDPLALAIISVFVISMNIFIHYNIFMNCT
ncbi:hypothetical protein L9F63_004228, partial [Diploptera punctata]